MTDNKEVNQVLRLPFRTILHTSKVDDILSILSSPFRTFLGNRKRGKADYLCAIAHGLLGGSGGMASSM